jgi:hypothetical protein
MIDCGARLVAVGSAFIRPGTSRMLSEEVLVNISILWGAEGGAGSGGGGLSFQSPPASSYSTLL